MICPNCGKDNKNTNIRCVYCGKELLSIDDKKEINYKSIEISSKKVGCLGFSLVSIFVIPWLLFGLIFIGVGLYSTNNVRMQAKNYDTTIGTIKNYSCNSKEECHAYYEYQVNGKAYTVSPSMISSKDGFKQTITVYYNPNNPSEAVVDTEWNYIVYVGILIVVIVLAILIYRIIRIKNFTNNNDKITLNVNQDILK